MRFLENDDLGRLMLRLGLGVMVLFHGMAKLTTPAMLTAIARALEAAGLPASLAYATLIGEIVAPLMLLIGWRARIAGLLIAINMLTALTLVHGARLLTLDAQGGWALELSSLFLCGALAMVFLGSGRLALRPD